MVPNDQLSLAIGKNGQNVRLAAKLTNWKIDIKGKDDVQPAVVNDTAKVVKKTSKKTTTKKTTVKKVAKDKKPTKAEEKAE